MPHVPAALRQLTYMEKQCVRALQPFAKLAVLGTRAGTGQTGMRGQLIAMNADVPATVSALLPLLPDEAALWVTQATTGHAGNEGGARTLQPVRVDRVYSALRWLTGSTRVNNTQRPNNSFYAPILLRPEHEFMAAMALWCQRFTRVADPEPSAGLRKEREIDR